MTDYANPEVDALLDEAAATEDEARRYELYQEAEQRILEDAPLIPIYHDVQYTLVKPYVRGLHITPMGILDLSTVELVRGE
jgi:ABC-type transport system substrate-binding protein